MFFNVELRMCREGFSLVSPIYTYEMQGEVSATAVLDFSSYGSRSCSEWSDDYGPFPEACSVWEVPFCLSQFGLQNCAFPFRH